MDFDHWFAGQGKPRVQPSTPVDNSEQAAFEKWLYEKCPSGDCESVHRQWLESWAYAEWLDEQEDSTHD